MNSENNPIVYKFPPLELIDDPILKKQLLLLREETITQRLPVLWSSESKVAIKDLADINHLLVVGSQGQGKSNFLHQVLLSLLFTQTPTAIKFLLIDFKRLEFSIYSHVHQQYLLDIPGLKLPIVSETIENLMAALESIQLEIDRRLNLFVQINARNIREYHQKQSAVSTGAIENVTWLPYIIVLADELADLNLHSQKELRQLIERLLTKAGKVGIIFVMATGVITGNSLPAGILSGIEEKIAFTLFDREDYRKYFHTVNFTPPQNKGEFAYRENAGVSIGKSILIEPNQTATLLLYIGNQSWPNPSYRLPIRKPDPDPNPLGLADQDPLFEEAALLIVVNQLGSTSLIQRKMKLGYNRAGRLMEQLEAAGIVGPGEGSRPREVLIKTEAELATVFRHVTVLPIQDSTQHELTSNPTPDASSTNLSKMSSNDKPGCAFLMVGLTAIILITGFARHPSASLTRVRSMTKNASLRPANAIQFGFLKKTLKVSLQNAVTSNQYR